MIKPSVTRSKARKGLALKLSELAIVSGYDRNVLSSMNLPLQAKKISLQDFQRIMRKRQDWQERNFRKKVGAIDHNRLKQPADSNAPASSPDSANNGQQRAAADMFYGRSSKRAGKAASRPPRATPLLCTA
jgi:hypothetical protein